MHPCRARTSTGHITGRAPIQQHRQISSPQLGSLGGSDSQPCTWREPAGVSPALLSLIPAGIRMELPPCTTLHRGPESRAGPARLPAPQSPTPAQPRAWRPRAGAALLPARLLPREPGAVASNALLGVPRAEGHEAPLLVARLSWPQASSTPAAVTPGRLGATVPRLRHRLALEGPPHPRPPVLVFLSRSLGLALGRDTKGIAELHRMCSLWSGFFPRHPPGPPRPLPWRGELGAPWPRPAPPPAPAELCPDFRFPSQPGSGLRALSRSPLALRRLHCVPGAHQPRYCPGCQPLPALAWAPRARDHQHSSSSCWRGGGWGLVQPSPPITSQCGAPEQQHQPREAQKCKRLFPSPTPRG
nr:translation initiation factor IF-2 isoform X1 [Oryctolagus cuniculus]